MPLQRATHRRRAHCPKQGGAITLVETMKFATKQCDHEIQGHCGSDKDLATTCGPQLRITNMPSS